MRCNNNTFGFVLSRMSQLLSDGSRPNKVFKDKDVNLVAKAMKEFCGEVVSPTQVYNHLRKWRQKWARVVKRRILVGLCGMLMPMPSCLSRITTLATAR